MKKCKVYQQEQRISSLISNSGIIKLGMIKNIKLKLKSSQQKKINS